MKPHDIDCSILFTFLVVHLVALVAVFQTRFDIEGAALTVGMVFFRWLGFSCAAHRYFSHRVCRTSRWFQFILGIWGTLTMARSPIKFASGHRHHHLHSDRQGDLHSVHHQGVMGAYLGWVVSKRYSETRLGHVQDLLRYPELVWLNRLYFLPNLALLYVLYVVGGQVALTYGGLVSIIIMWHTAFTVTVLFHCVGKPAYETGDSSKNSFILGVLMCGEGWHNNHHANARSARLGHEWWQIDIGYTVFFLLEKMGLVWNLNTAVGPAHAGIGRVEVTSQPTPWQEWRSSLTERERRNAISSVRPKTAAY